MEFFIDESCGACVPCRGLTAIARDVLKKIIDGKGVQKDLDNLIAWGNIMKANRCGLGQTAMNPILSSIKNFPELYEEKIKKKKDYVSNFNINDALKESLELTGRKFY